MAREISKLYRELAEIPLYTAAFYLTSSPRVSTVRVTTSVRDHLRNIKRTLHKHVVSSSSGVPLVTSSQDASDAVASVPSPSGKRLGVLRETVDGTAKKRFVEVWLGDKLEAVKDVTKTHEDFHVNPLFFSLSFSKSESSLVYSAEAKRPDFDEASSKDSINKFRFTPDLGERFVGKKSPTLYLFKWKTQLYEGGVGESSWTDNENDLSTIHELKPSLPKNPSVVFGQAVFTPDEEKIVATGYEETMDGRRLGVVGCWNRGPIGIWSLGLPKELPGDSDPITATARCLTPPDLSAHSPRITDAAPGQPFTIVWLANKVGGPHASVTALHAMRSDEEKPRVLVDFVSEPTDADGFPGLYVDQLPPRPFLTLDPQIAVASHLVTHSVWRSRQTILRISLESGEVKDMTPKANMAWTVAGTDGRDGVLATRSAPNSPNELLEARLQNVADIPTWKVLDKPLLTLNVRGKLASLESSVQPIPNRFPTEVITIGHTGPQKLPLISVPHGGPHGTFISEFNASMAALSLEGYTINMINYTGSLGFGQKYVEALIGRAGELDVQDCHASAKHLVDIGFAEEGPGKHFVQGGSHGGFLAGHLIGQYPKFYSAAVMRNPVTAVGEIASVSDIPDWAFVEFGIPFDPSSVIAPEIFARLHAASPIAYVDAVKAPVLLLVGEIDQRVPPSQAKTYYYALKGRGKDVDLLMFPGNGHPLDRVEAELVGWEAGRDWFAGHVKK